MHYFKELIEMTLHQLGKKYCSEDAVKLIYETAVTESGNFKYLKQMGQGPALGFTQLEPDTIDDLYNNFIVHRKELDRVFGWLGYNLKAIHNKQFIIPSNIALQIAFTRIHYWRVPESIPKSLELRAQYWKTYYNTPLGKGTVEHYLELNGVKTKKKKKK